MTRPTRSTPEENSARRNSVLSNVSVFRRLPTKVMDCDPDMYLFLVRHPDVVVDIWELMKLSRMQLGHRRRAVPDRRAWRGRRLAPLRLPRPQPARDLRRGGL